MIKLCIFDMDGLLLDTERYMWSKSLVQAAQEQGFVMTQELHLEFMGMGREGAGRYIKERFGDGFDPKKFFDRVFEINKGISANGIPLMKGAQELLDYLKKEHIHICLGTSSERQEALELLDKINVTHYFEEGVFGDEVENGKPSPEIYLKCLGKFDVDKSEAIVLEDGNAGAMAAITAGIPVIAVPDIAIISDEVKQKAFRIVEDLSKVIDIIKEENERTTCV